MKITIEVTQEDIDLGERRICDKCAVALAIRRATNLGVDVRPASALLYTLFRCSSIELPQDAQDFIKAFDARNPVQPFTFELDLPEWALKTNLPVWIVEGEKDADNATLRAEVERLKGYLERAGWGPCNIAACNCNGWHKMRMTRTENEAIDESVSESTRTLTNLLKRALEVFPDLESLNDHYHLKGMAQLQTEIAAVIKEGE